MENHKKLCFSTLVWGWYQDFIPTYIYSILHAFPQHHVKIFVYEELTENNKKCLELIPSANFEIVDNFKDLDWCQLPHLAAQRFLLTREYFEGFDYIYMGDVDFIVYNHFNDENFYDRYVSHCKSTGLPFSNEYNYDYGRYRVNGGLHFMIKDDYFDAMDYQIEKMKHPNEFKSNCQHHPLWPSYDEEMLYYMCNKAFDLRPINDYRSTYHGVHLGTFRIIGLGDSLCINHPADGRGYLPQWTRDLHKIEAIMDSKIFERFYESMCAEAKYIIDKTKFYLKGTKCFL